MGECDGPGTRINSFALVSYLPPVLANFLGHLNRIYGRGRALPAGDLKGDYGFIVE